MELVKDTDSRAIGPLKRIIPRGEENAMIRIRMIATAFLILAAMPGCGIFHKDRPCFPRLHAFFCGDKSHDSTVGYPVMSSGMQAPCETCSNPGVGGPIITGPITSPGAMQQIPQGQNIPNPKIGIKESDGKQFELNETGKVNGGPVLGMPAVGTKMN